MSIKIMLVATAFCVGYAPWTTCFGGDKPSPLACIQDYTCDVVRRDANEQYIQEMLLRQLSCEELARQDIILSGEVVTSIPKSCCPESQWYDLVKLYQKKPRAFELTLWMQPHGYVPACQLACLIRRICNSAQFLGHQDPVYLMDIFMKKARNDEFIEIINTL